jgi:uncharacterized protein (TIGR02646 family)
VIQVNKPKRRPAILRERGMVAAKAMWKAFDASPEDYARGAKTFEFDRGIYGHSSVKDALRKAQHDKCCFCESKVPHISPGDVEHFRPKAGYRQGFDDPLGRPGYYWLAYEWTNLYFCCQSCNQRFKRNLFPLGDPGARAVSHRDDIAREHPLFLDPGAVDPGLHIGFRKEIAYPIDGSPCGAATIESLGLNREELVERRRDDYQAMKLLKETRVLLAMKLEANPASRKLSAQLKKIDAFLARHLKDSAQYASMARALLT